MTDPMTEPQPTGWPEAQPMAALPPDECVLIWNNGYEVAHFNTALRDLVSCWDHRPIRGAVCWWRLPEITEAMKNAYVHETAWNPQPAPPPSGVNGRS